MQTKKLPQPITGTRSSEGVRAFASLGGPSQARSHARQLSPPADRRFCIAGGERVAALMAPVA
jgi:hypothetical protein